MIFSLALGMLVLSTSMGGTNGMGSVVDGAGDRYRAPALDKGLDILELLATTDEGLSQAEIAKALERSPNEIYRMLDRLVRRHYVARTSGDRYELTLKLFALAHQHAPVRRLVSQAMPELRAFARDAGQSCHLSIYDRGNVVVVRPSRCAQLLGLLDPGRRPNQPVQHGLRPRAAGLRVRAGARHDDRGTRTHAQ